MTDLEFKKNLLNGFNERLEMSKKLNIPVMYKYDLENYYDSQIIRLKNKINQIEQANIKNG